MFCQYFSLTARRNTLPTLNADAKTVTLKGPKGRTVDLMVEDPEQLKDINKGDRGQVDYAEALAVSVQPSDVK